MNASSDEILTALAGVQTKQIRCLLRILNDSSLRGIDFVKQRFSEQEGNFSETLEFLSRINWVVEHGGVLELTAGNEMANRSIRDDDRLRTLLIEALIAANSPYRNPLADYLVRFSETNSKLTFQPTVAERLRHASIRNLLIDLRTVEYRPNGDEYELIDYGVDLYLWAKNLKNHVSKETADAARKQREELGLAAECIIVDYEKERVGPRWASKVEHVSLEKPFALFDIKSVTIRDDITEARYIEVKAVPNDSLLFYWTASEVQVSRLVQDKYFLYLLPVLTGMRFDLANLVIVENPEVTLRENPDRWQIEENVIVCRQKLLR